MPRTNTTGRTPAKGINQSAGSPGPFISSSKVAVVKNKLIANAVCRSISNDGRAAKYRPAAPSDGYGSIQLSPEELRDQERLYREAVEYAVRFRREEDRCTFRIGCSSYTTNRAFVLSIEAARLLCSDGDGAEYATPGGRCRCRAVRRPPRTSRPRSAGTRAGLWTNRARAARAGPQFFVLFT
jgi:hypothetical protein